MMLKRHLGRVEAYYFQCWYVGIKKIKRNRAKKLKQFAARMKASRLLPGWNAWIYLHSIHKIARYCQSHFRGNRSRSKTNAYIKNLISKEHERAKLEEEFLAKKMKKLHWKYYMNRSARAAYRRVKDSRYLKYIERDKAIKIVTKKNMERNETARFEDIDEVRLVLQNIFTTFIMDPRHQHGAKFEVVAKSHVKIVLRECGFKMSKIRYEIFMNRLGLNDGKKNNVSFDEFFNSLLKMNLISAKFGLYNRSVRAYRHYSGSRYATAARLYRHQMAQSQQIKNLLEQYRALPGRQPLHHCEYCHKGFLLYTALHRHKQLAPEGCKPLLLNPVSVVNVPHFDVMGLFQQKVREGREKSYLTELANQIEAESRQTLHDAATEIQKIVRGWNARKVPLFQRMKEWYSFSSSNSEEESNKTPSSSSVCTASPEITPSSSDEEGIGLGRIYEGVHCDSP